MGGVLGNLDGVVDVLEQTNQANTQAEAGEEAQTDQKRPVRLDRHGRLDDARGNSHAGLLTICRLRIANSISLSFMRTICSTAILAVFEHRQDSLMLGNRFLHFGQKFVMLFAVGFQLAVALLQDHLGGR